MQPLVAAGADLNCRWGYGKTPLHIAAENGYDDVVKALIAAGAELNCHSDDGRTPLHLAAQDGGITVVQALTAAGVDVNSCCDYGTTPFAHGSNVWAPGRGEGTESRWCSCQC